MGKQGNTLCGSDYQQYRRPEKRWRLLGEQSRCLPFLEADLSPKEREGRDEDGNREKRALRIKFRLVVSAAIQ